MKNQNKARDCYAVFGNPIAHSKSPIVQMAFAQQTKQAIDYTAKCIDVENFSQATTEFFSSGGKGLNITVPFKKDAFNLAEILTPRALRAGAVNTLFLNNSNQLVGDNTDGVGLVTDIMEQLKWKIKHKRVLILGAGGAVRGVLEPLIQQHPKSLTIANRTLSKAHQLAEDFSDIFPIQVRSFSELVSNHFDIIINATSASLTGVLPPLPLDLISESTACYDMMYSKELTPFLLWAKDKGAFKLSDGLGMLVAQGAESFYIWRGLRPDIFPLVSQLRNQL